MSLQIKTFKSYKGTDLHTLIVKDGNATIETDETINEIYEIFDSLFRNNDDMANFIINKNKNLADEIHDILSGD